MSQCECYHPIMDGSVHLRHNGRSQVREVVVSLLVLVPFALFALNVQLHPPHQELQCWHVPQAKIGVLECWQSWGSLHYNRSVTDQPLRVAGLLTREGLGTHASSRIRIGPIASDVERLTGACGVDDATEGRGSVRFQVHCAGRVLFDSGVRRGGKPALRFSVAVKDCSSVVLVAKPTEDGTDFDHADWLELRLE